MKYNSFWVEFQLNMFPVTCTRKHGKKAQTLFVMLKRAICSKAHQPIIQHMLRIACANTAHTSSFVGPVAPKMSWPLQFKVFFRAMALCRTRVPPHAGIYKMWVPIAYTKDLNSWMIMWKTGKGMANGPMSMYAHFF